MIPGLETTFVQLSIGILVVAATLGCYFAACNVALKRFSRKRLAERLEAVGRLDRLERFLVRMDRYILLTGAIRSLMTLLIFTAVLLMTESGGWFPNELIRYLVAIAIAAVIVSMACVSVPVSWAKYAGEGLIAWSMPLLSVLSVIFEPLLQLMHSFDPLIRRLSGIDLKSENGAEITDEVLSIVEEHDHGGAVNERQKEMLEAVFDLSRTTAGEIMTPRTDVQGVEVSSTLEQARDLIISDGHSRYPVYEESLDQIVGVLYAKDMLRYVGSDGDAFDIREVMRDALLVPESKPVQELLAEFKATKVHIAIVLDEYGGTAGLITVEDIVEEVVGDIQDEYEQEQEAPSIQRLDDTTCEVDARVYVDDLNDELDTNLPEDEDYDTIGGFVTSTLGHIPDVNESFEYDNIRLTVLDAQRTRVNRVRIEIMAPAGDARGGRREENAGDNIGK